MALNLKAMDRSDSLDFESYQKSFNRVSISYSLLEEKLVSELHSKQLNPSSFNLFLRAFKKEKILQLWAWSDSSPAVLFKQYPVCELSGKLGPKRKQGDQQVPEGIYHISVFNPMSNYLLSLGINYPNESDNFFSDKKSPGGDIYIHGHCSSSGCLAMGDDAIREIYVLSVKARNSGQDSIPVHIFPFEMNKENFNLFQLAAGKNSPLIPFWNSLLPFYRYFEEQKKLPKVEVDLKGFYKITE